MFDTTKGNCPICFALIDPMKFNWDCVVCGENNKEMSVFSVCKRCKFGPRLIKCPACNKEFEGMLLIGSYVGKKKSIIQPDELLQSKRYFYKLVDLDFKISGRINENELRNVSKENLISILNTQFYSPIPLYRFLLLTYFKDDRDVNWFHGWAFQTKEWPSESEEATAQISFYFQSALEKPDITIKITDILVDA